MNQPHNSINKQDSHKKTHVDSDKKHTILSYQH